MTMLLALAAATAMPTPAQAQDLRCVALLAIVASEQRRGTGGGETPDVQDDGADYAAIVGADVMRSTGHTRERVRDELLAAVAAVQKTKILPRPAIDQCVARMRARLPALPTPTLPRCAAIMSLAYEGVKARDGLTKDAKDLATLASVLAYRTRETAKAGGKTEAVADAQIGGERDKAVRTGGAPAAELRACAKLAAPDGAR